MIFIQENNLKILPLKCQPFSGLIVWYRDAVDQFDIQQCDDMLHVAFTYRDGLTKPA